MNNKNTKKLIIVASIIILILLLVPIRYVLKDGGTIVYQSLIYKITSYHSLDERYESGYLEGTEFELLGFSIYKNIKKPDAAIIDYKYTIDTIKTRNCTNEPKLYHKMPDKNIYTYCLDNIIIDTGSERIELKDYIEKNSNVVEEIINTLTSVEIYKDGGTTVYRDMEPSEFTKNGLTVIKCNKILTNNSVNKDIYFGPMGMGFVDGFCTREGTNIKTFTRTYNVLNIADSNDDTYLYLTIKQFQGEEVETVKVLRRLALAIKEGHNYEFTFEYEEFKDEDLKSIFNNYKLISIYETDKVGLEQRQDSI